MVYHLGTWQPGEPCSQTYPSSSYTDLQYGVATAIMVQEVFRHFYKSRDAGCYTSKDLSVFTENLWVLTRGISSCSLR